MADVIRILGIASAAFALGALFMLGIAKPGSTGMRVPWRYWGVAAGVLIEGTGVVYRIVLFGSPLDWRDVNFLLINICISVAAVGLLTTGPPDKKEGP